MNDSLRRRRPRKRRMKIRIVQGHPRRNSISNNAHTFGSRHLSFPSLHLVTFQKDQIPKTSKQPHSTQRPIVSRLWLGKSEMFSTLTSGSSNQTNSRRISRVLGRRLRRISRKRSFSLLSIRRLLWTSEPSTI